MNRAQRNALVVENLPLVGYLVSDLTARATHLSREDLASAGALALISAADGYDPDHGVPFGAFARKRILGAFADELRSADWAPRSVRRRIKDTVAVQETLIAALGRRPTIDEIASALGVDRATAQAGLDDAGRSVTSLDEFTVDSLPADIPLPEETLLVRERLDYLRMAVAALPERTRYIVEQIYFHDRSVKELAEELGVTHSAVSQRRSEALRLIRDGLAAHYPDSDSPAPEPAGPPARAAYLDRLAAETTGIVRAVPYPAA